MEGHGWRDTGEGDCLPWYDKVRMQETCGWGIFGIHRRRHAGGGSLEFIVGDMRVEDLWNSPSETCGFTGCSFLLGHTLCKRAIM